MIGNLALIGVAILGILFGVFFFERVVKISLYKRAYVPENALDLLEMNKPDVWNEVRSQNPKWEPKIKGLNLNNKILQGANFQRSILKDVTFEGAFLDGADFSYANLDNVNFRNASLVGTILDYAEIRNCDFNDAKKTNISAKGIDNEQLNLDYEKENLEQRFLDEPQRMLELIRKKPGMLDDLGPNQFEKMMAYLFRNLGFVVQEMPDGHDRGFDFILEKADPIYGQQTYIVEIKKTSKGFRVGLSSIRALYAQFLIQKTDYSMLITTTDVTNDARLFAEQFSVRIINRDNLLQMIRDVKKPKQR